VIPRKITGRLKYLKTEYSLKHPKIGSVAGFQLAKKNASPTQRIAILIGDLRNTKEEEALSGLFDSFEKSTRGDHDLTFDLFDIKNDITQAHRVCQALFDRDPVPLVCVTIGVTATAGFNDVNQASSECIPHIFISPDAPLSHEGLNQANNMCGVTTKLPHYRRVVGALRHLLPQKKRAVFVYDVNYKDALGLEYGLKSQEYFHLEQMLEGHGYDIVTVPLMRGVNPVEALEEFVKNGEILIIDTSKAPSAQIYLAEIQELCAEYSTTIFATSATAVRYGAALGLGNAGFQYGQSAGHKLYVIMYHGTSPADIGVTTITESEELRFNNLFLGTQGVRISKELETILNARSVDVDYGGL